MGNAKEKVDAFLKALRNNYWIIYICYTVYILSMSNVNPIGVFEQGVFFLATLVFCIERLDNAFKFKYSCVDL